MQKLFFFLLSFVVFMCQAETVTKNTALQKASQFLQKEQIVSIDGKKKLELAPETISNAYYIFNIENQGGFVIVSGDDRMPEILGYSRHGSLEVATAPCNVRWLLDSYEKAAQNISQSNTNTFRRSEESVREPISPLILTEWGQGSPYNDLCPNAEGGNCVTGCVATSMAQVINYYRWPQGETGIVDAYVSDRYHISMAQLSPTKFKWDNMTSNEIARLMLYCGQSVKMDYGPGSSAAYVENITSAMTDVFDYSEIISLQARDNYKTESWEQLIYDDLLRGHPIIYNGQGADGGHSFVVCGYQDMRFYINWGWNGELDGYFDLSVLAPGNGTDFSWGQSAITDIQLPADAGDISRPKAVVHQMAVNEKTLSRSSANEDFPAVSICSTVVSDLTDDATIQIGLGLYNADSLLQIIASGEHAFEGTEPYTYEAEVAISASLPQGDYTIKAVNRMQVGDDWLSDAAASDCYVSLTIEEKEARLQVFPKTHDDEYYIEYGTHTIDGITYELVCEYENYRAYVTYYNETEKYSGDVYVPDTVSYANMLFKVFKVYKWNVFENSPELTSLSIGVHNENLNNCPKLKNLEIRKNVTSWGEIKYCDALESVAYPSNIHNITPPSNCRSLKEIRFATAGRLRLSMDDYTWRTGSLPSLTDVYFNSDYPPEAEGISTLESNPNVTIHIPQGTLAYYQNSMFRNWKLVEDQPAIPIHVEWDYCGSDEDACCGMAAGRGNNDVEFAMCVPASHLTAYKGCKVTKIEFYSTSPSINDWHMEDVEYVFLTKPGTDYLAKVPLTTIRGAWNTVELPEPYVITGDQLFVGYGRNKSLAAWFANLNIVDEGFYMRVMGTDDSWGMSREVGLWQKHAGETDFNHPLPIRFYIEGNNLPIDVVASQIEIVNADGEQSASSPALSQPLQPSSVSDGYFTLSQGRLFEANHDYACAKPAEARAVIQRAANGKMQIKTTVCSRTQRIIEELTIDWAIDNQIQGSQRFGTCLLPNHKETYYIDLPDNIQGRNHFVKVDIAEIDGEPDAIKANSCDTVSFVLPATTRFPRRIVMEEVTGTWCGYCPRGIETIRLALEKCPDSFIPVVIHDDDVMYPNNGSFDPILVQFSDIPNSLINRTSVLDPDWWELEEMIEENKDKADALITVEAYFGGADSSFVQVDTEITFGYDDEGTTDYRIAYVILEDKVGPYWQTNYYSDPDVESDPDDYMDGWIHSAYQVEMLFDHVARAVVPDWLGVEGCLPQVINEGQVYQNKYQFKLPSNVDDKNNLRIVALLIDNTAGEIMNAAQCPIVYDETQYSKEILADKAHESVFDIYSTTGVLVKRQATSFSGLPHGVYIVRSAKGDMKYCH